ncbi:hypothetical protein WMF26_44240 [Sorangium sp. So ce185]|uniref:hypothetical protein n=1 Tax=Sorangium sp. So ce185 TaxID=3133287 RepID=UPI003F62ACC1
MGVEDFKVAIESSVSQDDAAGLLLRIPGASPADSLSPKARCALVRGEDCVFEIEIRATGGESRMEFGMAICHPIAGLKKFTALVSQMITVLCAESVSIMEDLPEGVPGDFPPAPLEGFADAMARGLAFRREHWRADFGVYEAAITSREALYRFVLRET